MPRKSKAVQAFFDQETKKYVEERYTGKGCEHFAYQSRKRIVLEMVDHYRGKILDVGCGPAIYTKELLERNLRPFSVDLSLEMLNKGRESLGAAAEGCFWVNSELEKLPFKEASFDGLLAIGVIAYTEDTEEAIRQLFRLLKNDGGLIVQCSNALSPTAWLIKMKDTILARFGRRAKTYDFKLVTFSPGRFAGLLERNGFEVLDQRSYDFRLPFLEKIMPKLAVRLMRRVHPLLTHSRVGLGLGEGFILRARKRSK